MYDFFINLSFFYHFNLNFLFQKISSINEFDCTQKCTSGVTFNQVNAIYTRKAVSCYNKPISTSGSNSSSSALKFSPLNDKTLYLIVVIFFGIDSNRLFKFI